MWTWIYKHILIWFTNWCSWGPQVKQTVSDSIALCSYMSRIMSYPGYGLTLIYGTNIAWATWQMFKSTSKPAVSFQKRWKLFYVSYDQKIRLICLWKCFILKVSNCLSLKVLAYDLPLGLGWTLAIFSWGPGTKNLTASVNPWAIPAWPPAQGPSRPSPRPEARH